MASVANMIGWGVIWVSVVSGVLFALVMTWVFFPMRFQWSRDLPSHMDTPSGPLRLTAMVGVSSRRRARWFFGFMLMRDGCAPRARVTATKSSGEQRHSPSEASTPCQTRDEP